VAVEGEVATGAREDWEEEEGEEVEEDGDSDEEEADDGEEVEMETDGASADFTAGGTP
jgi:hypothetical protein